MNTWIRTEVFFDESDPQNIGWSWRTSLVAHPNNVVSFLSGPAESEDDAREKAHLAISNIRPLK